MTKELNAKVTCRADLGPELAVFRVAPDDGEISEFKPGQFATLGLYGSAPRCPHALPEKKEADPGKLIRRAYSIASSPKIREYLEFYVVLVKEGVLTPRLWNLHVGDPVFLGKKITGLFTMDDVPPDVNIVFIATGTGIAPYMSMLYTFLKADQKRKFALFHGVRVSQDLSYQTELLGLQNIFSQFSYFPIISRPHLDPIPWKSRVGHVQKIWESGTLEKVWGFKPLPKNTHIFLCGAPNMIDDMVALAGKDGFIEHKKSTPGQIHVERYW